ncbi:MAG: ATP-dependent nuclease [Acidimicrobiales bacterium]
MVVLDEPALSLHPAWQCLLAARVREAPGQFLVVTHSLYLVPIEKPNDLAGVVRLTRSNGATVLRRYATAAANAAADHQLESRILREFSLSADARGLLFAAGAVLVEGETELGALPLWFERSETARALGTPAHLHLGFFSVGGEKHFVPVLALLFALGIPWVIVCDGGPFRADMRGSHIFRQVLSAGAGDTSLRAFVDKSLGADDTDLTFEEVVTVGREHAVLTLASGWTRAEKRNGIVGDESFEAFAESVAPGKLSEAAQAVGSSKVRIGRWLAENVPCPGEVGDLYHQVLTALGLDGAAGPVKSPSQPDDTVPR